MVENRFVMKLFGIILIIVPALIFLQNIDTNLIIPFFVFGVLSFITWKTDSLLTLLVWAILGVAIFSNSDESVISTVIFPFVFGAIWILVIYKYATWTKQLGKIQAKIPYWKGKSVSPHISFPWITIFIGIALILLSFFRVITPFMGLFITVFFIGILFFKEHARLSGVLIILFSLFISFSSFLPISLGLEEAVSALNEFSFIFEFGLFGFLYSLVLLLIGIFSFKFGGFLDKVFGSIIIIISIVILPPFSIFNINFVFSLSNYIDSFFNFSSGFIIVHNALLFFIGVIFLLECAKSDKDALGNFNVGEAIGGTFSSVDMDIRKQKEEEMQRKKQEEERLKQEQAEQRAQLLELAREQREHQRQMELLAEKERLRNERKQKKIIS